MDTVAPVPLSANEKHPGLSVVVRHFHPQQLADLDPMVEQELHHHQIPQTDPPAEITVQPVHLPLDRLEEGIDLFFR